MSGFDQETPIHLAPPAAEMAMVSCQHSYLVDPPA